MRKHLYVDNVDLATYGVYINGDGVFTAPEKVHEWFEVPNRDGAVLGLERRLRNIHVSYECFIYTNFDSNVQALRNFLLSRDGLVRIADDYHPDEFRMGVYSGGFAPKVTPILDAGSFTLTFECQPQRWLTSGDEFITQEFEESGGAYTIQLTNPTLFDAKPLLKVTFDWSRDATIKYIRFVPTSDTSTYIYFEDLPTAYTEVTIDCETMAIYRITSTFQTNLAEYFKIVKDSVYNVDFPKLQKGLTSIRVGTSSSAKRFVSKIEIKPRWWRV